MAGTCILEHVILYGLKCYLWLKHYLYIMLYGLIIIIMQLLMWFIIYDYFLLVWPITWA
ncbi:hypothetical protein BDA96_05G101800 [Sorghum bicolor]|uniref:Uncharacterized protein n=2 Tax=Sorghum bicolor TaxID=4558 RepID=A0A921UF91_SORBI|nr:hypothetical protein BDA96_05G101800 [Sorghum bicolor]KXG28217.1 hypothetical protein SORBI_3005G098900 [Sorghum bicolor]